MYPTILIVSPTKNDARYLERHLQAWEKVDYPRARIRWVWMYGRSVDKTLEILEKYFSSGKWNAEIYEEPPFENKTNSAIWIADVLNALRKTYNNEDFVVIDDTDIIRIPPTTLRELIDLDLDIVSPYVWIEGTNPKQFFDTYVFRDLDGNKYPAFDLPNLDSPDPIELSSVGSFVVVKGSIFERIEFENPIPNLQFCRNAGKKGYKVYGIPWVNIYHANVFRERNEIHLPVEWYVEQGKLPKEVLEKVR